MYKLTNIENREIVKIIEYYEIWENNILGDFSINEIWGAFDMVENTNLKENYVDDLWDLITNVLMIQINNGYAIKIGKWEISKL